MPLLNLYLSLTRLSEDVIRIQCWWPESKCYTDIYAGKVILIPNQVMQMPKVIFWACHSHDANQEKWESGELELENEDL